MANVKISQLPAFTGNTTGSWLIMNNSGETQTFKVLLSNVLQSGSSGTSGTSGTSGISGSSGSSGTSGVNGTSGTSGNSGSSGTSGTSGSSGTNGTSGSSGTASIINNNDTYVLTATGTSGFIRGEQKFRYDNTTEQFICTGSMRLTGNTHQIIGGTNITGSVRVTGSLNVISSGSLSFSQSVLNIVGVGSGGTGLDEAQLRITGSYGQFQLFGTKIGGQPQTTQRIWANDVSGINSGITSGIEISVNTDVASGEGIKITEFEFDSGLSINRRDTIFQIPNGRLSPNRPIRTPRSMIISGSLQVGGANPSFTVSGSNVNHTGSVRVTGSLNVTGSLVITGSAKITNLLNLTPFNPLPAGSTGDIALSSSLELFVNDSGTWVKL